MFIALDKTIFVDYQFSLNKKLRVECSFFVPLIYR
jgi:hypothetical protein